MKFSIDSIFVTKVEEDLAFFPFLSPEEKTTIGELVRYKVLEIKKIVNMRTFE